MRTDIYEFLKNAKGVIHVGASFGQERDLYNEYGVPVIWIEANHDVFKELSNHLKSYPNQRAFNFLVTDKDGVDTQFNIANNSYSSSVLPLGRHREIWPHIDFIDSEIIQSVTLTKALETYGVDLSQYDTLILDVQGAELLVLEGAKDILFHFRYIRCEASNVELYEGGVLDHQLDKFLKQVGFVRSQVWTMPESRDGIAIYEILYEDYKRKKNAKVHDAVSGNSAEVKVGVVSSVPRIIFRSYSSVMFNAFGGTQFPICEVGGAFWEQSIQNGMQGLVELNCDYIITVDGDSIFDREDVMQLIRMAVRYPKADAVAALQVKRQAKNEALIGFKTEDGKSFAQNVMLRDVLTDEVTLVDHTVFGLTLIKVPALLKMSLPWFQSFPNAKGEWKEGKTDADAYFWRKWQECGNTIYSANDALIGHLEEVIAWVNPNFDLQYQKVKDFYKVGRPF